MFCKLVVGRSLAVRYADGVTYTNIILMEERNATLFTINKI